MNKERFLFNTQSGISAMFQNRFRALLTSLGMIFGVSAVISMLSVGNGIEKEVLEQMKSIGSNNIIIKPVYPEPGEKDESYKTETNNSKGISLLDAENIKNTIPGVVDVSAEIEKKGRYYYKGISVTGKMLGVDNAFFSVNNIKLADGNFFSPLHLTYSDPVCILDYSLSKKFFAGQNPIGKKIKFQHVWFTVVGTTQIRSISAKALEELSISASELMGYIPINTMLLRIGIPQSTVQDYGDEEVTVITSEADLANNEEAKNKALHKIDRLVVHIDDSEMMGKTALLLKNLLKRRHYNQEDFELVVPEELLKAKHENQRRFNILLAVIASISLVVGGIGIMNIMLASVMERTKEIGIRMAIGARKSDIIMQFLFEAVFISISGGIIGIILGLSVSFIIEKVYHFETLVTGFSVFISFTISITVGIIFGFFPAKKASENNIINSLRYE